MRTVLRLSIVTIAAALGHFAVLCALMASGRGPFGRNFTRAASGAMNQYHPAVSQAWFDDAARAIALDRFVIWPVTLLLALIVASRLLPRAPWWQFVPLALSVLSLEVPPEPLPVPGFSLWSAWFAVLGRLFLYCLFVGVCALLLSRISREPKPSAT